MYNSEVSTKIAMSSSCVCTHAAALFFSLSLSHQSIFLSRHSHDRGIIFFLSYPILPSRILPFSETVSRTCRASRRYSSLLRSKALIISSVILTLGMYTYRFLFFFLYYLSGSLSFFVSAGSIDKTILLPSFPIKPLNYNKTWRSRSYDSTILVRSFSPFYTRSV